jgi:Beta-lactamase superfamily domain
MKLEGIIEMIKISYSFAIPMFLGLLLLGCNTPALTVYYERNAQVEVISKQRMRILIDVYDPSKLSSPATESDILLITHKHSDHFNPFFNSSFKGKMIVMSEEELKIENIRIQGVYSTHSPHSGDNYFYIIDVDKIRIVHFGDIGQEKFSAEQLSKLGTVDLAIMQFDNPYSEMNIENNNGFKLMSEIRPSLIIPTHFSIEAAKYAMTIWPCLYSEKQYVRIHKKAAPNTRMLFMGTSTAEDILHKSYAEITKAAKWNE